MSLLPALCDTYTYYPAFEKCTLYTLRCSIVLGIIRIDTIWKMIYRPSSLLYGHGREWEIVRVPERN